MYDISQLKKKLLSELQEISEKLKITNYKKLKKTDLIYEILDKQSIGKKDEGINDSSEFLRKSSFLRILMKSCDFYVFVFHEILIEFL